MAGAGANNFAPALAMLAAMGRDLTLILADGWNRNAANR